MSIILHETSNGTPFITATESTFDKAVMNALLARQAIRFSSMFFAKLRDPHNRKPVRWMNGKCVVSNYIKHRLKPVPANKWTLPKELKQPINASL